MTEPGATPDLTIRLNAQDNVVVARADILPGTAVPGEGVNCRTTFRAATSWRPAPSPRANRSASSTRSSASRPRRFPAGGHVHVRNVEMAAFERDHARRR